MIKNEIKRFKLNVGSSSVDCEIPASVYSLSLEDTAQFSSGGGCSFDSDVAVTVAEKQSKYAFLKISGIYANAEVFFNGKSYGMTTSCDRTYYFDITDGIKLGDNVLSIVCTSALGARARLNSGGTLDKEYELPSYVPDMGIIGSCEILYTDSAIISDVRVKQLHENGAVTLLLDIDTLGDTADIRHALTLVSPDGKIYFGGIGNGRGLVNVPDPALWYPRGLGNPALYKLSVTLYHGAEAADVYEKRIGLRKIETRMTGTGAPTVVINGCPIFSLGATYVTERAIVSTVTKQGTEALIKKAADANMNTLAVYSYTVSPSEHFYDLCDRYGILVWQDIPVPIITSNVAGAFASGLSDSLKSLISRAASHTSAALMYLSVVSDGRSSVTKESIGEFREIIKRLLEPIIEKYAPTVPFYFDPLVLFARDERYLSASREGFAPSVLASMPDMMTLSEIAVEDTNILSPSVEDTVKIKGALESMILCSASTLKFPYGKDEVSYAGAYAPAFAVARSIKRARLDPMHTMSAVFRQLNDSEALISGSFIDAGGRKKALCYLSEDAFAPVTVYADARGGKLTIGISNNTKKQYSGRLTYALYDTYGKCHAEKMKTVDLAPCSAHTTAIEEDYTRIVASEPELYYVVYQLADYNGVRATGSEIFVKPKRFAFIDPQISAEVSGSGKRFTVKLTAKKYARAVFVYLDGIAADADKNYISVIPGTPEMVTLDLCEVKTSLEVKDKLRLISIYNIGG